MDGAAPGGQVFNIFNNVDLDVRLADFVLAACKATYELDCNANGIPDDCDIDENSTAPGGPFFCTSNCDTDCNNNGLPDACDVLCDSEDCEPDGIPDECEIDVNTPGGTYFCTTPPCDPDCDNNGVPDSCQIDCNNTNLPDVCDIAQGTSEDCDSNSVPDECQVDDCNANDVPDSCDIDSGFSCDWDLNLVPDECAACCDSGACTNRLPENCATPYEGVTCGDKTTDCTCAAQACCRGTSCTCDTPFCCTGTSCAIIPDCECLSDRGYPVPPTPSATCDAVENSPFPTIPAPCGQVACCSGGGCFEDEVSACSASVLVHGAKCSVIPSVCDDPVMAECCVDSECPVSCDSKISVCTGGACDFEARDCGVNDDECRTEPNRYIKLCGATLDGGMRSLRVTLNSVNGFPAANGEVRWVRFPETITNGNPQFTAAPLQCDRPSGRDWSTEGEFYLYGVEIVPGSTYDIVTVDSQDVEGSDFRTVATKIWGDVYPPFSTDAGAPLQPDFTDISAIIDRFQNGPNAPIRVEVQLQPDVPVPGTEVGFLDIAEAVAAFVGDVYPFRGPQACPSALYACSATPCTTQVDCPGGCCYFEGPTAEDKYCHDSAGACSAQ